MKLVQMGVWCIRILRDFATPYCFFILLLPSSKNTHITQRPKEVVILNYFRRKLNQWALWARLKMWESTYFAFVVFLALIGEGWADKHAGVFYDHLSRRDVTRTEQATSVDWRSANSNRRHHYHHHHHHHHSHHHHPYHHHHHHLQHHRRRHHHHITIITSSSSPSSSSSPPSSSTTTSPPSSSSPSSSTSSSSSSASLSSLLSFASSLFPSIDSFVHSFTWRHRRSACWSRTASTVGSAWPLAGRGRWDAWEAQAEASRVSQNDCAPDGRRFMVGLRLTFNSRHYRWQKFDV